MFCRCSSVAYVVLHDFLADCTKVSLLYSCIISACVVEFSYSSDQRLVFNYLSRSKRSTGVVQLRCVVFLRDNMIPLFLVTVLCEIELRFGI
jgi:hypothetical protein